MRLSSSLSHPRHPRYLHPSLYQQRYCLCALALFYCCCLSCNSIDVAAELRKAPENLVVSISSVECISYHTMPCHQGAGKLFALLSSKGSTDFPLCDDCANSMSDKYTSALRDLREHNDAKRYGMVWYPVVLHTTLQSTHCMYLKVYLVHAVVCAVILIRISNKQAISFDIITLAHGWLDKRLR